MTVKSDYLRRGGGGARARPRRKGYDRGRQTTVVRTVALAIGASLIASLTSGTIAAAQEEPPPILEQDNDDLGDIQTGLVIAHNIGMVAGFSWEPISSIAGETTANLTNFALKFVPPILEVPDDITTKPAGNDCSVTFSLPQRSDAYTNLFGLFDVDPVATDWGLLTSGDAGSPVVQHANTDVTLTLTGSGIPDGEGSADIILDEGTHTFIWRAETQISDLFDIWLPAGLQVVNAFVEAKYGELISKYLSRQGITRQAYKNALQVAFNIAVEAGLVTGDLLSDTSRPSDPWARQALPQSVIVQDIHTPTIQFDPSIATDPDRVDRVTVEARDFGGIAFDRVEANLRARLVAGDPCDETVRVTGDWTEALMPISDEDHTITWTAADNPASIYAPGVDPTASVIQFVRVEDTQAPILVAPPSRVIESFEAVPSDEPTLGTPRVVDLADPAPSVTVDNTTDFAVDSRTLVEWTARDASGNASTATQTITVKVPGTNTAPVANDTTATTLTSAPVDIVLTAGDGDLIQGTLDPLTMRIDRRPEHGEFVAPLYPYFIEDYRMSPVGPFGGWDSDGTYSRFQDFLKGEFCDQSPRQPIPIDWVYAPAFFQVLDDGTTFIRDQFWTCDQIVANTPKTAGRISAWDRDRNFLGQTTDIQDDSRIETFEIDDEYLYTVSWLNRGSATNRMVVERTPQDFAAGGQAESWEICDCPGTEVPNPSPVSFRTLINGRPDATGELLYVVDEKSVSVWDARSESLVNGNKPVYLANLAGTNLDAILASNGSGGSRGHNLALDSEGNVYVAGSGRDRIHKITRSYFADDGTFVAGEYVGWLGKCTSAVEKRCDEEAGVSRGFSCTDETCTVEDDTAGTAQGQFDDPSYVAIDPNDIIYVADFGNRRIQRFSPDGTFAGEAKSVAEGVTTDGTFVLGNFGAPQHVTVNSDQFFILEGDASESFLHVFESSPIHPESVTADSATVTYVSDFMSGPRDSFTFVASDGLADSRPATVSIDINRADRAPVVADTAVSVAEDQSVDVELIGDDPDGIEGRDFLGLDTLAFEIIEQPAHGAAVGSPGTCGTGQDATHTICLTYTPEADFNGTDGFKVEAVDSRGVRSTPATVSVDVSPVGDAPSVSMEPFTAFRGFPTIVSFDYDDPDESAQEQYQFRYAFDAAVNPDDGTGILTPGGEHGFDLYEGATKTAGINASRGPGRGTVGIPHTFEDARTYAVTGCAKDATEEQFVCAADIAVDVVESAELAVYLTDPLNPEPAPESDTFEPYQPSLAPGQHLDLLLQIENLLPSSYPGHDATGVTVDLTNTVGIELEPLPGCTASPSGVRCDLGSLAPAAVRDLSLGVVATADGFPAVQSLLGVEVRYTDVSGARERRTAMSVGVDWPDSDGDQMPDAYESATGLDPNVDDALGDIDGDGVSNVDQYFETLANNGVPIDRNPSPEAPEGGNGDEAAPPLEGDGPETGGFGLMRALGVAAAAVLALAGLAVGIGRLRSKS
jgi:hypothetical protein